MSMIQCPKHGLQHVAETSPYVRKLILSNQPLDKKVFPVKFYLNFFNRYFWFWSDLDFIMSLGVAYRHESGYVAIDTLGEEESLEVSFNVEPVCAACYTEFIEKNNLVFPDESFE